MMFAQYVCVDSQHSCNWINEDRPIHVFTHCTSPQIKKYYVTVNVIGYVMYVLMKQDIHLIYIGYTYTLAKYI
jgi:hypothetical protein